MACGWCLNQLSKNESREWSVKIGFTRVREQYGEAVPACTPYPYTTGRQWSAGWDVKRTVVRGMARPEDSHAAHAASDGGDDAGYAEVVEKVSDSLAYYQ